MFFRTSIQAMWAILVGVAVWDASKSSSPKSMPTLRPVVASEAGPDLQVHSWGSGEMGQLGFPLLEDRVTEGAGFNRGCVRVRTRSVFKLASQNSVSGDFICVCGKLLCTLQAIVLGSGFACK